MPYQRMAQMPLLKNDSYWLAEPQTGLLETLYQSEPDPDPITLFEGTDYAAQAEQSPILFKLSAKGLFPSLIRDDPQQLSGLLITTCHSQPELLKQLRSLLEARFQQHRKALLRYYDPRVASYLLPTCAGSLHRRWLGPINEIIWYGSTWADEWAGRKGWHHLANDEPELGHINRVPLALTEEQIQRLVEQGYERFAWHWLQRRPEYNMNRVLGWIEAGITAGHTEQDSLTAWLDSRATLQGEQHG